MHRASIVSVLRHGKPHQSEKRKLVKDSNLPKRALQQLKKTHHDIGRQLYNRKQHFNSKENVQRVE